jgi:hypothetical protein
LHDRIDDGLARNIASADCHSLLVNRGNDVRLDRLGAENGDEPRNARFAKNAVDGRRPAALRP